MPIYFPKRFNEMHRPALIATIRFTERQHVTALLCARAGLYNWKSAILKEQNVKLETVKPAGSCIVHTNLHRARYECAVYIEEVKVER